MRSSLSLHVLFLLLAMSTMKAWSNDGRIISFEGDVRVNGQPVAADTVLNREDTITTAHGATVKIVLSDNSVLDLDGGSKILISDYSFDPEEPENNTSKVDILSGTLRYVSGHIAKDDPKNISFTAGNSTIGVRGTYLSITVAPEAE
jgi:hypothetical protein